MKLHPAILAALLLGTALVSWSAIAYVRASHDRTLAETQLTESKAAASKLARLRSLQEVTAIGRRPEEGLLNHVTDALTRAGIASNAMTSLTSEPESPIGTREGVSYVRQRARMQLQDVTLAELGRWLAIWSESRTGWVPVSFDITPAKPPTMLQHADTPRLRATISLEASYIDDTELQTNQIDPKEGG